MEEKQVKDRKIDEVSFALDGRQYYPLKDHPIRKVFESAATVRSISSQPVVGGEVRSLEITASPIFAQGRVEKVLEVIRDITEREKMEKEILLRDQELKEAQERMVSSERLRALGEMAAGVAHGFNNLLSGILGNIQNILEDTKDPRLRASLKLIEKSTLDGAEIVRRIQEFSRVRRAGTYRELDVNEIVQDTIKITEAKWKNEAESRGIRFNLVTDLKPLPPIYGNGSELREALTNVLLNAFEAMPEGGEIRVSTRQVGSKIELVIEDTGRGMDEETAKKIFDPFFTTKGVKGTGLGLSITYGIITRHDGEIGVESEPGKGTRFTITLPVKEIETKEEKKVEAAQVEPGDVLVIDDEPMILRALETMLRKAGHRVTCCSSGRDGLEQLERHSFDVVITDLGMQEISGWDVTKTIREKGIDAGIIMLTGWGFQLDEEQAKMAGVDLLMSKPFTKAQIVEAVNSLLASRSQETG